MQAGASTLSRFTNLLIFVGILLLALGVALYQVNRVLQELLHTQQALYSSPASWNQNMQWLAAGRHGLYDLPSSLANASEPASGRLHVHPAAAHQDEVDNIVKEQVHGLLKEAMTNYREEMEELKGRVAEAEREIKKGSYTQDLFQSRLAQLESKFKQAVAPPATFVQLFLPLKDTITQEKGDSHVHHYFMSVLKGRGMVEGPPELFIFPQGPNEPRLLCLRGNSTSDGTQNSYALVVKEDIPTDALLVAGTTLLSDTFWDFINPWHSMFNLLQFVYWRMDNKCSHAQNLLLFHQGEFRTSLGSWIKSIFKASGLPTEAQTIHELASRSSRALNGVQPPTICFEQAIVSRSGIGGMQRPLLTRMFREARCQARRACNVRVGVPEYEEGDFTSTSKRHANVTLVVRKGARGFVDEAAWQRVVKDQCEAALNCSWSVMYVANLTFCQQVEAMSHTNILVSAHGAQLANIIFMPPGGSVLEMFPFGWLEMAGHGQYIYRNLAKWVGLQHEGYWRDLSTPPCPDKSDAGACFTHYKDQPLGINVSYIEKWLGDVIERYQQQPLLATDLVQRPKALNSDLNSCECH